jgi:tetratricopeptide (TPR) repeat protein
VNSLAGLKQYAPSKHLLYSLLAVLSMLIIAVCDFLFLRSSVLPQVQIRRELTARLASAQAGLIEAKGSQEDAPGRITHQLATAQARLDHAADVFLSDDQAAEALSRLYDHADASEVTITALQAQPDPKGQEGVVASRRFGLAVEGSLPRLIDFVSRIEWTAVEGFNVTNLQIVEGDTLHVLTLDITLFTSPYSTGKGASGLPVSTRSVTSVDGVQPPPGLTQLDDALDAAWAASQWQLAIELIDRIRAIDSGNEDVVQKLYAAYVNYGRELLDLGDASGALTQFSAALKINPEGEEAVGGQERAMATPIPTQTAVEQLAQQLHDPWAAEDWEKVIQLVDQIRAIDPDYDDITEKLYAAHTNYAYTLIGAGKLEEAKDNFTRALTLNPDGGEAISGLEQLAGGVAPLPSPSSTPAPYQPQYVTYVVQPGETLYSIARRYGTTVEAVMAANRLSNYDIYAGQPLSIPLY